MSGGRKGSPTRYGGSHSRRLYRHNNKWYFHTRELMEQGPFHTLDEAESCLEDYVMTMSSGYLPVDQSGEFEPLYSRIRD